MDSKSIDTDTENETPQTKYFKMMMQDNEIGRVELGDDADADSIIGGQTIASLMDGGQISAGARNSNAAESYAESNEKLSIVGYDEDVSTLGNDTENENTKAFFTGNGDRKDSKPRIRLFKEYKNDYKTPEKKKRNAKQSDDEKTQPETPPGMIQVPSSQTSKSSQNKEESGAKGKNKILFLRSRQRVYLIAGLLALILFVAIIALAVALKGVRGGETSGSSSSAIDSSGGKNGNGILDVWPDLEMDNDNDEEPSVEEPSDELNNPVVTSLGPTFSPTVRPPTLEPTIDRSAEIRFTEALNLLIERNIVANEKEIVKRQDSPQYKSTVWLSRDPNYYDYTQDRLIQRWSLAVLAQSLDPSIEVGNSVRGRQLQVSQSDLLPGWMTYTDECTWFSSATTGLPCDQDGIYQTLDLQDIMLGGTLPTELALLSNLQNIFLDGNGLIGIIPQELDNLSNLVSLHLRRNNLEDGLSIDFGKLVGLKILDVGRNRLTGSVYSIVDLDSPTEIRLDYNELGGDIPWDIGNLETLSTLALNDNRFTGWLPESLEDLKDLEILTLGNNNLEGELPGGVCKLKGLETLSLDCVEQGCECCTECATTDSPSSNPTEEPTSSPSFSPSASPSASPTTSPTASPTASPTISPTAVPTAPPTVSPTGSPTASPSASPTGGPTASPSKSPTIAPSSSPVEQVPTSSPTECAIDISVRDFCFAPLENIQVSLTNCDSQRDDWVGIYKVDANFDRDNLVNPELWTWSCGTRNCIEPVGQKVISFNSIHGDTGKWPLQEGLYIAVMARNTQQPYTAYAMSDTFVIAAQC